MFTFTPIEINGKSPIRVSQARGPTELNCAGAFTNFIECLFNFTKEAEEVLGQKKIPQTALQYFYGEGKRESYNLLASAFEDLVYCL